MTLLASDCRIGPVRDSSVLKHDTYCHLGELSTFVSVSEDDCFCRRLLPTAPNRRNSSMLALLLL